MVADCRSRGRIGCCDAVLIGRCLSITKLYSVTHNLEIGLKLGEKRARM